MSILPSILASVIGAFAFLFLYWRRLKEDYSQNLIFGSGFTFVILVSVLPLVLTPVSKVVGDTNIFRASQLWFWGMMLGFAAALYVSVTRHRLKLVETFEAGALGLFVWVSAIFLSDFVTNMRPESLVLAAFLAFLFGIFFFLDARYRSFAWYKSGKVGFSGLAVSGIFFVVRMGVAYLAPQTFSVMGRVDAIASAIAAFLIFFSLYNLAEA